MAFHVLGTVRCGAIYAARSNDFSHKLAFNDGWICGYDDGWCCASNGHVAELLCRYANSPTKRAEVQSLSLSDHVFHPVGASKRPHADAYYKAIGSAFVITISTDERIPLPLYLPTI